MTRFGLFVRLSDTGADGLVPVSNLGDEYFVHDDRAHALVGQNTGQRWPLGRMVSVKLIEATPITGGLLFEMLSEPDPRDPKAPLPRLGLRGPGPPGRGANRPGGPKPGKSAPRGKRRR